MKNGSVQNGWKLNQTIKNQKNLKIFRETKTTFVLTSFEEDIKALTSLINQTQKEICIFSHLLSPMIFDTEPVVSACEKFCLKNHRTKINVLVDETRPITRISHRLLGLSHRFSSSVFFKKTASKNLICVKTNK